MADERLACCRSASMMVTKSDKVASRPLAISLNPFQNASSRLTLVLWPERTIDRFLIVDFMACLPPVKPPSILGIFRHNCDGQLLSRVARPGARPDDRGRAPGRL